MGKQSISRKAWQRAVNVLLWYPDNVAEHASLLTEGADNQRLHLLELEIDAVEQALATLPEDQHIVVRRRFWDIQKGHGIYRKPRQYDFLQDIGYSERTMRRASRQVILAVAEQLGEK